MLSKNANTVWAIAHRYASESGTDQHVLSWTGFFHEDSDVEQDKLHESHSVYYLPAIDQPSNKVSMFCAYTSFLLYVFNVSLSIFLIAFKAKGLVSIYYQFCLARIYERSFNKVILKNVKVIFSN